MAAGWLLRTRPLRYVFIPYAAIAIPLMPLISSLLLWPAGVTDPMQTALRTLMTAVTLLALVRHWPAGLIVPLYAAGLAGVARLDGTGTTLTSGPLPAWLQFAAAGVAVAAILWHAFARRAATRAGE